MIGVALVGVGRWGKQLLRVLEGRCRVVRCGYRSNSQTREWLQAHAPHIAPTIDYDEILRDPRVEAVVLATPISTHAALARQALEAGKHVFVEKPLATDPVDAHALVALAKARQRVVFTGHVFLYHPVFERLRELTRQDRPRVMTIHWAKCGTFEEDLFWSLLPHDVAIAAALFDAGPSDLSVLEEQGLVTGCDVAVISLRFGEDRACLLHVNRCAAVKRKTVTVATDAGQVFHWEQETLYRLGAEQTFEPIFDSSEEPLAREIDAFVRALQEPAGSRWESAVDLTVVDVVDRLAARSASRGTSSPARIVPSRLAARSASRGTSFAASMAARSAARARGAARVVER